MRMLLALFLLPLIAQAGDSPQEVAAREQRDRIWLAEETDKYCREHPQSTYRYDFHGKEVPVDCELRNQYVDQVLLADAKPQEQGSQEPPLR